jgi:tRNA (guanine37-N1)-methyltransferase
LPPDAEEIPSGFSIVGHVAHINLRKPFFPYKHLIAQVILDKNPVVKTVINKVDNVGDESEFRTFQYEVLAGPDELDVVVAEAGCQFRFNYSKVYWNTRLETEHTRMVGIFKEGEAICDVMAGIGPFAVPAGKKRVFVWANDLNPESFACLTDAIARNKVAEYVKPFNQDGHKFIKEAAAELWGTQHSVAVKAKAKRDATISAKEGSAGSRFKTVVQKTLQQPRAFDHFVMNLPATALEFLPSFVGLYSTIPDMSRDAPLPWIHVYCFNTKSDDNVDESHKICEEISRLLAYKFRFAAKDMAELEEGEVHIHDVRDVAPKKRMFCASFKLPKEVAWRLV